jgi:hypothetical protein
MGILLIAIVSFEVGFLEGRKNEQKPFVIEKAPAMEIPSNRGNSEAVLGVEASGNTKDALNNANDKECVFVGSKNSNKFHKPDCQWAKRIKAENIVCFKSEEEAKSRGYVADKCVK